MDFGKRLFLWKKFTYRYFLIVCAIYIRKNCMVSGTQLGLSLTDNQVHKDLQFI